MADPVNHLADKTGSTVELLADLSDDELDEHIAYLQDRRQWHLTQTDEPKPPNPYRSHSYAAYRIGNQLGWAQSERASRH